MKVLYTGALLDSSGYSEAGRNYISALLTIPNINLAAQVCSFESWKTEMPVFQRKLAPLLNKKFGMPDVHIIHLTPDNFPRFKIAGARNVGMTVWETNHLPPEWVGHCNQMDSIYVPCSYNVDSFVSSGVLAPVRKLPHCFDLAEMQCPVPAPRVVQGFPTDRFSFYSIFQWSARKNPEGLIRAYLSEFGAEEKVALILKTYNFNNSELDKTQILNSVQALKRELGGPPVLIVHEALSRQEILTLHKLGNCFVLPHRSEGWGLGHFEAMAMGKPTIATNYGGNLEFMSKENSWLVDYSLTPVNGMNRSHYNSSMKWAEPSITSIRAAMREAYSNEELRKAKASMALSEIKNFSIENIGALAAKLIGLK
jgi:glycosyltransferase involved in cell wall biosynthesis